MNKIHNALKTIAKMKVDYSVSFEKMNYTKDAVMCIKINGYTFNYYEDGTANCITPLEKGCRNCLCWDKLDSACKSMIEIAKG